MSVSAIDPINIQREAFLRFWASMNNLDYDFVVKEYLGQADNISLTISNKLYMNVETAIHFMRSTQPNPHKEQL
jgi:hypothetical protein